jgi:hypothetical protein
VVRKLIQAATIVSLSTVASAQEQGLVLYSKGHFQGFSQTIDGPRTNMSPLDVKSIRVPRGTSWDLCSGNTFSGCVRFSESKEAMARTVRSIRPVAPAIPETATTSTSAGAVAGSGPSLRGLASEFFVVPTQGGSRIEVAGAAAGASSTAATEFCRTHGWRMSVYERVQTISSRMFLADVLCVNEDR